MMTTAEQLIGINEQIEAAAATVESDPGASPVLGAGRQGACAQGPEGGGQSPRRRYPRTAFVNRGGGAGGGQRESGS